MSRKKLVGRIGALAILLAILLRFASVVAWGSEQPLLTQKDFLSLLLQSQTGRQPQSTTMPTQPSTLFPSTPPASTATTQPSTLFPSTPLASTAPVVAPVTFSAADKNHVKLTYSCDYRPDLQTLLTKKQTWDLSADAPTVLIIHTHGTESYTETPDTRYQEYGGNFRTNDDRYNLISVGAALAQRLEAAGIRVIHDRTPYDKDDYLNAYDKARAAIQAHLKAHPTIRLVLDLHRDAAEYPDGSQWATSATVGGEKAAQIMFVVGTDAGGNLHPHWQENLSVAEKLHVLMEKSCAGITRPIDLRSQRFNQDLSPAAMIVEVGAAGNTHPEAIAAVPILAEAIIALRHGSA